MEISVPGCAGDGFVSDKRRRQFTPEKLAFSNSVRCTGTSST